MLAKEIITAIEAFAPPVYQESYDNSGLQVGDRNMEIKGVMITLDVTEPVLQDAIAQGCNMVVAHHPVIFGGLRRLTGGTYTERIVAMAIKNDILIYAAHTNLDNVRHGVSAVMAKRLGLQNTHILQMSTGSLRKLYTFAPLDAADKVREAMWRAGAGTIGHYKEASFNTQGKGTFTPDEDASPAIGKAGGGREVVDEVKIEVLIEQHLERAVTDALFEAHPYEEVAYEIVQLQGANQEKGAGIGGMLPEPMDGKDFLHLLKSALQTDCIRHTEILRRKIEKVAVCGGSGSFLLKQAISTGADVLVTGDFKYHQFFDADNKIMVADVGHYESEQYTGELLRDIILDKFPNFAVILGRNTNPVNYFF